MRTLIVVLKFFVLVVLVTALGGLIYLNRIKTKALPDYNALIDIENLIDEVIVYRDQLAIPHIYAQNESDLYRAVGYVMAQDRLWQMDLIRRITLGKLSEVLDPELINVDLLFRALQFSQKSEAVLGKTDPEIVACIEAYCDGVNQFVNTHGNKLPFEFTLLGYHPEPWTPIHVANMIGYMAWDLSTAWNTEVVLYKIAQKVDTARYCELWPDMDYQPTSIFPKYMMENDLDIESALSEVNKVIDDLGLQVFSGSNNWVVSGKKSVTGAPLLANDMHLGLNTPGIWYQMHQIVKGGLNVTGVVLPGQPFVICGHNNDIAWGMTNMMLDDIDFYMETINPENENEYRLNGEWENLKVVRETIKMKDNENDTVMVNKFTHRGPVISSFKGIPDKVISMRWVGNNYSNELKSVYLLNRAQDWFDFREACSTFTSLAQNIIYADNDGNIGLQISAGVPIRDGNGIIIYPGDTTQFDWKGIVPFDELPFSLNPQSGMLSSANNKTVGDNYPYYISHWFDLPNRIERIRELLLAKEKLSVPDFKAIQADCNSVFARKFNPVFVEALENCEWSETEQKALGLLKNWNNVMLAESSAALIFEELYRQLIFAVFHDELGEELYNALIVQKLVPTYLLDKVRVTKNSKWLDNVNTTDKIETLDDDIRTAFKMAISHLCGIEGNDVAKWQWGHLHTLTLKHPLGTSRLVEKVFKVNRGPYPVKGSFHTVGLYSYPMRDVYNATHGASERHIFDVANWDRSETVIPTGTSGIPASEFYCDQTEMYIDNEYHSDWFSLGEVQKNARFISVMK